MLYVTDLDKTLLRSDLTVSTFTRDVWNFLVGNGVMLTFATARSLWKAQSLIPELLMCEPCIALNGCHISMNEESDIFWQLDKLTVETLISIGKANSISPMLLGFDGEAEVLVYGEFRSNFESQFIHMRSNEPRLRKHIKVSPPEKVLSVVFLGDEDCVNGVKSAVSKSLGCSVEIKVASDPYIDGAISLEVLHPKGDKVHALEYILEKRGLSWKDVTYFGDHLNDMAIGSKVSRCIGVANSVPEFASICDIILTESNDEDAVAKFLLREFEGLQTGHLRT